MDTNTRSASISKRTFQVWIRSIIQFFKSISYNQVQQKDKCKNISGMDSLPPGNQAASPCPSAQPRKAQSLPCPTAPCGNARNHGSLVGENWDRTKGKDTWFWRITLCKKSVMTYQLKDLLFVLICPPCKSVLLPLPRVVEKQAAPFIPDIF